jgi:hypothetical protein
MVTRSLSKTGLRNADEKPEKIVIELLIPAQKWKPVVVILDSASMIT